MSDGTNNGFVFPPEVMRAAARSEAVRAILEKIQGVDWTEHPTVREDVARQLGEFQQHCRRVEERHAARLANLRLVLSLFPERRRRSIDDFDPLKDDVVEFVNGLVDAGEMSLAEVAAILGGSEQEALELLAAVEAAPSEDTSKLFTFLTTAERRGPVCGGRRNAPGRRRGGTQPVHDPRS